MTFFVYFGIGVGLAAMGFLLGLMVGETMGYQQGLQRSARRREELKWKSWTR